MNIPTRLLCGMVRSYRLFVSPILPPTCRYSPTCSEYALESLAKFGALRGSWLALCRICRCHPWGDSGWDPVPNTAVNQSKRHVASSRRH